MTAAFHLSHEFRNASEHLAVVQSLCLEVQGAIRALTANRLAEFKASLARQEDLCARLEEEMKPTAEPVTSYQPSRAPSSECDPVSGRVRAAHRQLADLNRRYAALLRRSSRTAKLLAANCHTCIGDLNATDPSRSGRPTWRAEI